MNLSILCRKTDALRCRPSAWVSRGARTKTTGIHTVAPGGGNGGTGHPSICDHCRHAAGCSCYSYPEGCAEYAPAKGRAVGALRALAANLRYLWNEEPQRLTPWLVAITLVVWTLVTWVIMEALA